MPNKENQNNNKSDQPINMSGISSNSTTSAIISKITTS